MKLNCHYLIYFLAVPLACGPPDRASGVRAASPADGVAERSAERAAIADSLERPIRELLQEQQEAWNRGDLEGFMAGYWRSPDLVFTSGGRVQRGFDTVLERYRATYGTGAEMGRLGFSDLEVHALGSEAAWALGRWDLELARQRLGGVFTLVLRRIEGEWKIVHDHTSIDSVPRAASGVARAHARKESR